MATRRASENLFPVLRMTYEDDTPATPPAGQGQLVAGADKLLRWIDDDGVLYDLTTGVSEITTVPTAETDAALVLRPDGAGGVEWGQSGTPSGTSNPGSPSTGDRFYRTDLNLAIVYDGTRWLCQCPHVLPFPQDTAVPFSATGSARVAQPGLALGLSIWIEKLWANTHVLTTNDGTRYWTIALTATGTTLSTINNTPSTDVVETANVNASIATSTNVLFANVTRVGSTPGNLYMALGLSYRFIVT